VNAARAWLIVGVQRPKRFPAKWIPVRVKKTRQIKNWILRSDFNRNGKGSHADIYRNLLREPDVKAPLPKSD
jgi:hypothetical protein